MRGTRGLLLLAIALILAGVGTTYYRQKRTQTRQAPPPPKALPAGVEAAARDWQWSRNTGSRPVVEVRARNFRQLQDPERTELEKVELRLYHQDGREYDRVRSAHAIFDPARGTLYSGGDVEITMGMPAQGPPGRLVFIRSSGVTFDSQTGKASTDRLARFTFDQGQGKAVGASYDPSTRELHMRSEVELHWRGRGPKSRPMKLEAGEVIYKEADAVVMLSPWSRLTRENAVLDAAGAVVTLRDGAIRDVEAKQARGSDRYPARQLDYAADQLWMTFTPQGEIEKLTGEGNARLVSTAAGARTTVSTDRVDLEFEAGAEESVLRKALATGKSTLESQPLPRAGVAPSETRILRSEVITLAMRPGGKEIEQIQTEAPGELEFLPNRPGQRHRVLKGERLWISYGPENRIHSFRAVDVATRTDAAPPGPPVETTSRDLTAEFDPKTGQLTQLEQWNDFRYQEGPRHARSLRAVLEEARHLITLESAARVWDAGGSVSANRILMDQTSGDVTAEGKVVSTHLPERKGKSSAMLSHEESTEAQADRMTTSERRRRIVYEGHAVLRQGANRLRAHRIEIDRAAGRLLAQGQVESQLADKPKTGARRAPSFVVVQAGQLVYTEEDRLAHYSGGVRLSRAGVDVRAEEIRAFLREAEADASLDRAHAAGRVEILHTEAGRSRRATAEQADYYVAEERIVLRGGEPSLADSARGHTRGRQLTWFVNDDRLLVDGFETQPALSRIRRK